MPEVVSVSLKVGLEVHVELATRSKVFSSAPNPAHPDHDGAGPNTLIDPTVLALPGSLPVLNRAAVERSILVGLALGCEIPQRTKWDRKSYFYPDLPKAYQISQYDLPLCRDGAVDLPEADADGFPDFSKPTRRIRIIRAHLEEDAGKLLHEAPGGGASDVTLVDYNRAGTPLLEIVTAPDFDSPQSVVLFARMLRRTCRYLGATEGVMQKGHMRFEPNINCDLILSDGRRVTTPIVEVKNLNSFKSLLGAIDYELVHQPRRYLEDGRTMGPGEKTTRGWDDVRGVTFPQREKEDAHDYRYFPDPDLPPVHVDAEWRDRIAATLPEPAERRLRRYIERFDLKVKEAAALVEERPCSDLFEAVIRGIVDAGVREERAGKIAANLLLQQAMKHANERGVQVHELGLLPGPLASLAVLREQGRIGNQGVDSLFTALVEQPDAVPDDLAQRMGLLIVRDQGAMDAWIEAAFAAHPKSVEDVRAGKVQAVGRLVGEVMKHAGGAADAKSVRDEILRKLTVVGQ
ncbi:MAG: Asp-tRNA(Asn)/Glu-tRNA(Gln) amidotransferase subunit GatB [Phycisphaerae bacterium]|nr:Asp-tRNA(Asn)/Glu-tRNA(Gln) amidotransferase subunit GatB [Phycisphaerae bacterium]